MRAFIGESDLYEVGPQFEHICIEPVVWDDRKSKTKAKRKHR